MGHLARLGWHSQHTMWPVGHWKIGLMRGGRMHTGHSRRARIESVSILLIEEWRWLTLEEIGQFAEIVWI